MTAASPSPIAMDAATLAAARTRIRGALVAGVALASTGYIAAVTIGTLIAQDLLGNSALAGLPGATVVLGAAAGSLSLSWLMARAGRRPGLALGYGLGIAGAGIATIAVVDRSFPLLLLGTVLIGFANSAAQLARYAAADMEPARRRASAIGLIVWASTVGAVLGPSIVSPAGAFALSVGLPELAGPYLVPIVAVGLATVLSLAFLRPDPMRLSDHVVTGADHGTSAPLREVFRRPAVLGAVVALIAGQGTMVLVMTMTPLHMRQHGHDLAAVGLVLSAHTFGMFALSPISGRLTGRLGPLTTIYLGTAVMIVSSVMAAFTPPASSLLLGVSMFLLGYGWNLGFVAGSTLLSSSLEIAERTRVQGAADALIWVTAAIASLGSGLVVQYAGYLVLGLLGAALVALATWILVLRREAIAGSMRPRGAAA
ncbi:MAG: MFS transporter [Chloroflexi bacterium]|nr:MFS transporter [Chloroflexota bacterium]